MLNFKSINAFKLDFSLFAFLAFLKLGNTDIVSTENLLIFFVDKLLFSKNELYLQTINKTAKFKKWFFGHYHINREFQDGKYVCLYNDIIPLE